MKFLEPGWPSIETPPDMQRVPPLWKRLLWMGSIWLFSVTALLIVALVLRQLLR